MGKKKTQVICKETTKNTFNRWCFRFLPLAYCLLFVGLVWALPELPQKVKIGDTTTILEIADEQDEIVQGLSDRTALEPEHGMLFCFPDTAKRTFWMYHCSWFDVDLAYIGSDGVIREIQTMRAEPFDTPMQFLKTYPSKTTDIQYVIEMTGGWYAEHHIKPGDSTDCNRFPSKVVPGSFK